MVLYHDLVNCLSYSRYLDYLQNSLNANDSNMLESLAYKSPAKNGAVVYKARSLFSLFNAQYFVYNDDSCKYDASGNFYRFAPTVSEADDRTQQYRLSPNPNNGIFSVQQLVPDNKTVRLKVNSAIGGLVLQSTSTFSNGSLELNIGQQAQGLYLLYIVDEQEQTSCLRFILK